MVRSARLLGLASLAATASAWLPGVGPGKRSLVDTNGFSLFERDTSNNARRSSRNTDGESKRWMPASSKIRGVNLGSLFVFEPWIAEKSWAAMGCGGQNSEFDCVSHLGQDAGDAAFQGHWAGFLTEADFDQMAGYGLNTVRIPLGYWMDEDIVYRDSEHFPRGGFAYLKQVCGWASDRGFYIILDMHGAPGAQVASNADTGQFAPSPGFYQTYQYDRGVAFLKWLRQAVHDNAEMRNVGMIEVLNEPLQGSAPDSLHSYFYANARQAIRDVESALGVTPNNFVHVAMMNGLWGAGDPNEDMPTTYFLGYDDHRYLKWAPVNPVSKAEYLATSCNDDRGADGESPTVVGEFSLSVPDDVQWTADWEPSGNKDFYRQWFAAQVTAYEARTAGWVFWTWKSELGDYRWDYQAAVAAGVIPTDLDSIASSGACNGVGSP